LLPHVAEHLAIDFMVAAERVGGGQSHTHAGNTRWVDKEAGIMEVRLSYEGMATDEASAALEQAVAAINAVHLPD
jgi:hypothetical protein